MQKPKKKFNFNTGVFVLIALILIFGIIISVILWNDASNRIILPDYTADIDGELLGESGKLYEVRRRDFEKNTAFSATISAGDNYIVTYDVSDTELKLSAAVEKGDKLNSAGDDVISEYSGTLVAIEENGSGGKTLTILNNETFFVEFYVDQDQRQKINYSTPLDVRFGVYHFPATISNIDYNVVNGQIKVSASVSDPERRLLSGYRVSCEINDQKTAGALTVDFAAFDRQTAGTMLRAFIAVPDGDDYKFISKMITLVDYNGSYWLVEGVNEGDLIFIAY